MKNRLNYQDNTNSQSTKNPTTRKADRFEKTKEDFSRLAPDRKELILQTLLFEVLSSSGSK